MECTFRDVFVKMYSNVIVRRVEKINLGEIWAEKKMWIDSDTNKICHVTIRREKTINTVTNKCDGTTHEIVIGENGRWCERSYYDKAPDNHVKEIEYYDFDGIAGSTSLNPSAERNATKDRSITFSEDDYCQPDFLVEGHGWFSKKYANHTSSYNKLPHDGDVIMGIVNNNNDDPKFTRWFLPSPQFYRLWRKVVLNDSTALSDEWRKELNTKEHWAWRSDFCKRKRDLKTRMYWMRQQVHRFEGSSIGWSKMWVDFYDMILNDVLPKENSPQYHCLKKNYDQMKIGIIDNKYWNWVNDKYYEGYSENEEDDYF